MIAERLQRYPAFKATDGGGDRDCPWVAVWVDSFRLQRMARGQVVPESFTHGSSADRMRWLRRGLDNGTMEACDTFSGGTN